MKKKKSNKIPKFKTETEESKFWDENDSTDFIDWNNANKATFPNLKPSTQTISMRFPSAMLNEIKTLAHKQDIPYQSLIKVYLAERLQLEKTEVPLASLSKLLPFIKGLNIKEKKPKTYSHKKA